MAQYICVIFEKGINKFIRINSYVSKINLMSYLLLFLSFIFFFLDDGDDDGYFIYLDKFLRLKSLRTMMTLGWSDLLGENVVLALSTISYVIIRLWLSVYFDVI